MSELYPSVTLVEVHPVTREIISVHDVDLTDEAVDAADIDKWLLMNSKEIDQKARRLQAEALCASNGDMGDPVEVMSDLYTDGIHIDGPMKRPYSVSGLYFRDGGAWGDIINAVNSSEAGFSALWAMADNSRHRDFTLSPELDLAAHMTEMLRHQIIDVEPKRPNATEMLEVLEILVKGTPGSAEYREATDKGRELVDACRSVDSYDDELVYEENPRPRP